MQVRTLALAGAFAIGICGGAQAQTIEWVAGQLGGGWYTMANGMARMLEEKNSGLTVKVVPGGGTANPSKIQQGQSQLGMGLDIFAKAAHDGTLLYQGKPHDKLMMVGQSFSDNYLHIIRAKGAPLSVEEVFKTPNVRIGVTKAGSSDEMSFRFLMEHYGTSYEKLRASGAKIVQGDYNELASAFKDRQVDYLFIVLGVPGAMVQEIQQAREGELLPYPEAVREAFTNKYGYSLGVFPKTTYPKYQTADVPTLIMATTLMVSSAVPEDLVYKITKTLCENTGSLPRIHASMDVFDCKTAVKVRPVPVHPGALKYYKEKGFGS
jgi:TRAP transporter TAXI family solute receptor